MFASKRAPALLRLTVPRLEGHSYQDTQTYKSESEVEAEWARDPLPKLKTHCAKRQVGEDAWADLEREAAWQVQAALAEAEARGVSSPEKVTSNVFYEGELQQVGGLRNSGYEAPSSLPEPHAPKASASTWSPRSAACSTRSSKPTRACWCSARMSGPKVGSMQSRSVFRTSSAATACSTLASTKKASSAARSAWRSPG